MTQELRLSVSKTKTFIGCRKKFEYSYVIKLPRKEADYHIFGKFLHSVLEVFHKEYTDNKSTQPYNIVMTQAYKHAKNEYKEKMTSEMLKECYEIVKEYLELINKKVITVDNVIGNEKDFNLNIGNNIILNGMIDRIQVDPDDVIHVADYKSSKSTKYLKNDWFQLLTYAYVILQQFPDIKKVRASYVMLRHNCEFITKEFELDEILTIKDQYTKYANQILTEKEYTPNPTILCGWCEYLSLCEAGQKETRTYNGEVSW